MAANFFNGPTGLGRVPASHLNSYEPVAGDLLFYNKHVLPNVGYKIDSVNGLFRDIYNEEYSISLEQLRCAVSKK